MINYRFVKNNTIKRPAITSGRSFMPRKPRIVACVQARMGSSRLPGKVMRKICGKTLIKHIVTRLKAAKEIDEIVLSTTVEKRDDVLAKEAERLGINFFRGSESDLVSRLYHTMISCNADAFVRVTADCPLVDPEIVDRMVAVFKRAKKKPDYLTNVFPRSFPKGLDLEIFPVSVMKYLDSFLTDEFYRESFNVYIMDNPNKFRIQNIYNDRNLSFLRWTVDYPEDMMLVRKIFTHFGECIFHMRDILDFIRENPALTLMNINRADAASKEKIREFVKQIRNKSTRA